MQQVSKTRMQLLAHKAAISLARQGRDLLEQKRKSLMKEFSRLVDAVMEQSEELERAAARASKALARAQADAGIEAVRAAALAVRADLPLEIETANVMGVKVPRVEQKEVSRSPLERGYEMTGTSLTIDEAASDFELEVDAIIRLADTELQLTRLANEIQQTSRRVNALEHILIPRLQSELDYIQIALDERERSDLFRLKLVKRILQRKREREED
jgi:V/A-type H+-transporting ATPase subunit D